MKRKEKLRWLKMGGLRTNSQSGIAVITEVKKRDGIGRIN